MSSEMNPADLHLLTGAFATGALTDEEHDAFVAHLGSCANCQDEVAELVATTTLLGIAAAERPPAGFRERLMAEVAQTRQLPPVVSTLAEAKARKGFSRTRRWTMSAAASAVVVAVGLGAWGLSQDGTSGPSVAAITAIQTAADAKTVTTASGATTAALTVSRNTGDMVFMAHGLRDVGNKRTYQVWLLGPGSAVTSMGTFNSDGKGNTTRLFRAPGDATALAVTEEPAGGSARPTTQPVLAMDLPRA
ncbi:MAG TPA: anti-sigma factor [Sporichthya sp.]|nr:anti-sigma factor [Sporichthya sp.]